MIRLQRAGASLPSIIDITAPDWSPPADAVWIDMIEPSRSEELAVESALGLLVPTREEMSEIEASSRLYRENDATFLTANLLINGEAEVPATAAVSFILTPGPLVTVRYVDPSAFRRLNERIERQPELCAGPVAVFVNLVEAIVDRTADVLERNAAELESVSRDIFVDEGRTNYNRAIRRLGRAQTANSRISDSLTTLERALTFAALDPTVQADTSAREHIKSLSRDLRAINAQAGAVAQGITFQLNAALGLINIEQSQIIKIFSVAAVAFLPPTLIASIYGMNFDHMPELRWLAGYPAALIAMVISALVPLWIFQRKGWL